MAELDEIELLVHFDVASFWKAIQANDVAFNLLGSVTATITPNEATMSYDIEMINALSLESATRFDRNVEKDRIDGLIPNRERDASDTLELGGNLRCKWVWEEKLI